MPRANGVRRPPEAFPQSSRCLYSENGRRCRRLATVSGQLCRHHAARLELELERGNPIDDLIGAADRKASSSHDPFVKAAANFLGSLFGRARAAPTPSPNPPPDPRGSHSSSGRESRAPEPPRPQIDPIRRARAILGFEPGDKLTADRINERKKALAKVFHPDLKSGSEAQMKRVNAAVDVLLANPGRW